MKILSGTSNPRLSKEISRKLKSKLINTNIKRFADGEIYIEINENIRGNSVFVIQSTSNPANDNIMELLLCIDALRRSSAKNITAVIPYFGYARQDRKVAPRTSISAKVVSNLITNAGANRIVTVDLHAGQIQGFFDIPVDNLFTTPLFARYIKKKFKSKNLVCVSPDVGGVQRTRGLATKIKADLAIIDKRRPAPGKSQVMNIIGEVKGKNCIIVDDIIDSGGTIVNAVEALKKAGAIDVYVFITHAVLSGEAAEKIKRSKIKKLIITDTIENSSKIKNNSKIEVISIAPLMAEAINRISNSTSVSDLFN
ncbi:MAG: ribose-phosphate pyrophosphokinase [Pelagibacteraceae bacterium]|jgi:ribose-phosphate pyrophosphokinase|nr:ribose-phosphate pyrophosphokinase [Pelagibacteraceae bacterium]